MNNTFTTQAGNFVSAVQTGVDPRTGQFQVNFPLAQLTANRLLGPELSLSLNYSTSTHDNWGFGEGFSLGLTQYDSTSNLLSLSSGEKYRLARGSDVIRHQKLKHLRFTFTNGRDDSQGYQLAWKDGKVEYLTLVGYGFFTVSRIVSPLGHAVNLNWDFSGQIPILRTISDAYGELCSIDYRDNGATVTVWPQTTARYQLDFVLTNSRWLNNVTRRSQDASPLNWQMYYSQVGRGQDTRLLSAVDYPTGMRDEVIYQDEGLRFPAASGQNNYLPVVLKHRHLPGGGQAVSETEYRYSTQNFLGFNGNFGDWAADSDYMYTTLTEDYRYDSTATTYSEQGKVVVKRTYNNYHLQIEEEVQRDGVTQRSETEYYATPGVFIEGQPAQFLLPRKTTQCYIDNAGASRQEVTITEFDEYGNPSRQVAPDGTVTETVYYPAGGEGSACPAEPNGFVRFIKQKVVTPRRSDYPDTPMMKTQYSYKVLGDTRGVVQATVMQYSDQQLLLMKETDYQPSGNERGRITAITETRYQDGQAYRSRQQFGNQLSGDQLVQTISFTGHDRLTSSAQRVQQVDNGQLLQETDVQGIITAYRYDDLGRIVSKTHAVGGGYESTTRWSYRLEANGPVTIETDVKGVQVKICFDGTGRQIGQYRYESGQWYEITTQRYNALGQLVQISGQQGHSQYDYDALNRLISQQLNDEPTRALYYQGQELVNEVTSQQERRFIKSGHQCLGVSDGRGVTLTATDSHASVLWSQGGHHPEGKRHNWSAYSSSDSSEELLGFNGERPDPYSGVYHLGNGYRAYSPVLMRFTCPDDLSPFGAGGINAYAYCAGDPIDHTDPSGHISWQGIFGIIMGIVGAAVTLFTAGAALPGVIAGTTAITASTATSIAIGGIGLVADATAIASGALEDSHPEASSTLGWVSFATGLIGAGIGIGQGIWRAMKNRGSYNVSSVAMRNKKGGVIGRMASSSRNAHGVPEGAIELGDNYHLFIDPKKYHERLLVTAHGEQSLVPKYFDLPKGTSLSYYVEDGFKLVDPGLSRVAAETVIPNEIHFGGSMGRNYNIARYAADSDELARSIVKAYNVDVLTIRSNIKSELYPADLRNLFQVLKKNNITYKRVDAIICRAPWLPFKNIEGKHALSKL